MLVPEKRIAAFEKLGFGMFVHWGLYSQKGKGEWVSIFGEDIYNGKQLEFSQDSNSLKVVCTGYDYGCDYCVRVAKITLK